MIKDRRLVTDMDQEPEIKKIMEETGMGYIQARHHLQQRNYLRDKKEKYPLGRSNHEA